MIGRQTVVIAGCSFFRWPGSIRLPSAVGLSPRIFCLTTLSRSDDSLGLLQIASVNPSKPLEYIISWKYFRSLVPAWTIPFMSFLEHRCSRKGKQTSITTDLYPLPHCPRCNHALKTDSHGTRNTYQQKGLLWDKCIISLRWHRFWHYWKYYHIESRYLVCGGSLLWLFNVIRVVILVNFLHLLYQLLCFFFR